MEATGGNLPEDVEKLLGDVEDYLEMLQTENLSAKARVQKDEILFYIQQLKERYHSGFLPRGFPARFSPTQDDSDDSQTKSFIPYATAGAFLAHHNSENAEYNKASQDHVIILKQGYLEKRSRDPKIFGSEWQKRWCVLSNKTFYYFANEKSKQPKGMFGIENYHAQLVFHLRRDSRRDCCFELTCPGRRTYEFTAANSAEATDWVDQILFLLKDMKSLIIPCEEEVGHQEKEEDYDDIDSFDSPSVTLNQDAVLELEDEEDKGESNESIYEILPDEDLDFPALVDGEDIGDVQKTGRLVTRYVNYYQGLWDCTGGHPDELSFQRGDLIYIISKEYNMYGWWVGLLNHTVGIVPKEYLMPAYDMEEI